MLSGYGYFPPIETVVVLHTETASLASLAPQRRRRPYSRLRPHVGIVYPVVPPADATVETQLAAVTTAMSPRHVLYMAAVRPPQFVGTAAAPPETTVRLRLVAVQSNLYPPRRRRSRPVLAKPFYVVAAPQDAMGGTGIWLVQSRRPVIVTSMLWPPTVVNP